MAAFVAKQMVGNKLSAVKGESVLQTSTNRRRLICGNCPDLFAIWFGLKASAFCLPHDCFSDNFATIIHSFGRY